jgi:hypothetical protein
MQVQTTITAPLWISSVNDSATFSCKCLKSTCLDASPHDREPPWSSTISCFRFWRLPEKMFSLKLPQYSPSVSAPSYSFEPTCGERTLEVTPRPLRLLAESIYIKQSGKTTVILHNQEENVKIPSYGREGAISGSGLFHSSNDICEVVLEVCVCQVFQNYLSALNVTISTDLWKNRNHVIGRRRKHDPGCRHETGTMVGKPARRPLSTPDRVPSSIAPNLSRRSRRGATTSSHLRSGFPWRTCTIRSDKLFHANSRYTQAIWKAWLSEKDEEVRRSSLLPSAERSLQCNNTPILAGYSCHLNITLAHALAVLSSLNLAFTLASNPPLKSGIKPSCP